MHLKRYLLAIITIALILIVGAASCEKPIPTPTPPTPGPETTVTIDTPVEKAIVGHTFEVTGFSSNLPPDTNIWILIQPLDAPQYHPQSGPAIQLSGGQWSAMAYAGVSPFENIGEQFKVIAVVADQEASMAFLDYLREYEATGSYPGMISLPEGAKVLSAKTVIRQ